jgi:hypothetical protein
LSSKDAAKGSGESQLPFPSLARYAILVVPAASLFLWCRPYTGLPHAWTHTSIEIEELEATDKTEKEHTTRRVIVNNICTMKNSYKERQQTIEGAASYTKK